MAEYEIKRSSNSHKNKLIVIDKPRPHIKWDDSLVCAVGIKPEYMDPYSVVLDTRELDDLITALQFVQLRYTERRNNEITKEP